MISAPVPNGAGQAGPLLSRTCPTPGSVSQGASPDHQARGFAKETFAASRVDYAARSMGAAADDQGSLMEIPEHPTGNSS